VTPFLRVESSVLATLYVGHACFLAGFANMLNVLFLDTFIKRNTHQNGPLILSKGTFISKRNVVKYSFSQGFHQNGTLILSKWSSLNRNIHIKKEFIKMEYSSQWNTHIKMELIK